MKKIFNLQVVSRNIFLIIAGIFLSGNILLAQTGKAITFITKDSVKVTADLYIEHPEIAPFIVFFHQAGWSRGEYLEIAPKINKLGFNAMAVDQRSGEKINDVLNQTKKEAAKKGKATKYHHAIPDMQASIAYIKKTYPRAKLIIWGSSYSSALVLKLAGDSPKMIDGVLSFSPGEYFGRFGKGDDFISKSAKNIQCPVFITSAKNEVKMWKPIFDVIASSKKHSFTPSKNGHHGSRALWESKEGYREYWTALETFLKKYFL